jgi:hypothetical protein
LPYFFLYQKVTKNQGPMAIGLHRLGPIAIGLKLTLRFAAQKKLAPLKQFFVLFASLHLVFSTYPLRAVLLVPILIFNLLDTVSMPNYSLKQLVS